MAAGRHRKGVGQQRNRDVEKVSEHSLRELPDPGGIEDPTKGRVFEWAVVTRLRLAQPSA